MDSIPPQYGIPVALVLALAWWLQGSATRRARRRARRIP